jgi:hypothetical protein
MSGNFGTTQSKRRRPVGVRTIGPAAVAVALAFVLMSATSVVAGDFFVPSTISEEAQAATAGYKLERLLCAVDHF